MKAGAGINTMFKTMPPSTDTVMLLPDNPQRTFARICNTSDIGTLVAIVGAPQGSSSATGFKLIMIGGAFKDVPVGYTGPVYGYWNAAAIGVVANGFGCDIVESGG